MTAAIAPASRTVLANGLRLHALDWGNDGALPLVLLHGLGGCAADWTRVAAHFAGSYHVLALDQRGHGDSDRAPDGVYSTAAAVADLEAAVDALGLDRFVLCGHSMGGMNAIVYTARHPERVLCALANDIPPALSRERAATTDPSDPPAHAVYATREDAVAALAAERPTTPRHAVELLVDGRMRPVPGGLSFRSDPAAVAHWEFDDRWEDARAITRPIFFVRGGRSRVLSAETLMEMDMSIAPARSITLEQAGHDTYLDMEPEWLAVAEAFFAAHAR